MDEDVQFMKTSDGKRFPEIKNDFADIHFKDIIAKLEKPKKKFDGKNIFIEFSS